MAELMLFAETNLLWFVSLLVISTVLHELGHVFALIINGKRVLAVRFSLQNLVPEVVVDLRSISAGKLFFVASAGMTMSLVWFWLAAPLFVEVPLSFQILFSITTLTNLVPASKDASLPKKRYVLWQGRDAASTLMEIDSLSGAKVQSDGKYMLQAAITLTRQS